MNDNINDKNEDAEKNRNSNNENVNRKDDSKKEEANIVRKGKDRKKKKKVNEKKMSFLEHLEEFRWVMVKCIVSVVVLSIVGYLFAERLVDFITAPYPYTLIALAPSEPFMLRIKMAITVGSIASLPILIYQFWSFIAPGLLTREKKFVPWIIFFTMLCFLIGASFAYYIIMPLALNFLAKFQTAKLVMSVSIDKYVSFIVTFIIVFGLSFELPIVSVFLAKIGLLTPDFMKKNRVYAILIFFVGGALLTPPEVMSQIALAVPLIILYEVSIQLTKIFARKREEELEKDIEDEDDSYTEENEKDEE